MISQVLTRPGRLYWRGFGCCEGKVLLWMALLSIHESIIRGLVVKVYGIRGVGQNDKREGEER